MKFNQYEALNKQGIAVGHSNIRNDTVDFYYKAEEFSFPTVRVIPGIAKWNGYFYIAKIGELRKLVKKNGDQA